MEARMLCLLVGLVPGHAFAACDDLAGKILTKHLAPAIAQLSCPAGRPGHKLNGVCYESNGPVSHLTIDTTLNCHDSDESVASKLVGGKNKLSASENVSAEATVKGADCSIVDVRVDASGTLARILAKWFDADGRARKALEQGLAEACKR